MAEITAALVKELREITNAPMMECKQALVEASGDIERAQELLRIKLGNKASKVATRVAAEGALGIWISDDKKYGAMLEINSETDFVGKNPEFLNFIQKVAEIAGRAGVSDIAALSQLTFEKDISVEAARSALVGKIGENIVIQRMVYRKAEGHLVSYLHGGARLGVLLDLVGGDDSLGKDIGMHIAAMKPKSIDETGVDPKLIETERSIAQEKASISGKPPEIIAKIVDGTVQKYLKEVTLLNQFFVKNDSITVGELLSSHSAQIKYFSLFLVGESMEKLSSDFASEVAALQASVSHDS